MSVEELVAAAPVVPFTMAVVVIAVAVLRVPAAGPAELDDGIDLGLRSGLRALGTAGRTGVRA